MERADVAAVATAQATVGSWLEQHRELPRLELELLLCHHLDTGRAGLIANPSRSIDDKCLQRLDAAIVRLSAAEPLAYILGRKGFWDFDLEISSAVLIPRPETETLVEQALARIRPGDEILDLGTGSGAIAIALARSTDGSVLAVDSSVAALEIAASNARRLATPVTFRESNWYADVSEHFDVIVANPPYVAEADPHLADLRHEPMSALVSGPDGLDDMKIIIRAAPDHLNDGGWLLVEHGYDQADAVTALFETAGFQDVGTVPDLGGQPRVTYGRTAGEADHG